jgi:UDP-glucose:(heptosyl)LPS alpha-1,3-glucosyltransferase
MRIALVRRDFRLHGGAERFAARFLETLRCHGDQVTLITQKWGDLPSDVKLARIPRIPGSGALRTLSFAIFASHYARELSLDLVHSFDRILEQDLYRAGEGVHREWLRRRYTYVPRAATLFDPLRPLHRVILTLERRIFQQGAARLIVANSEQVAREIAHHYAPLSAPVKVVRNGVDLERFHPGARARLGPVARADLGLAPSDLVLLFLGSGFTRKGLAPLIRALGHLPGESRPHLLVVGKGRSAPYLALARRLGLEMNVRFFGVVPDPLPFYAAADAFVLPSLYDPSSNACLEAMAVGLPVITTRSNGASELIEDGREGWVLDDPRDARLLADHIRQAADPALRKEIGLRARARAEAYPWDRHLQEILALYSSLVSSSA